MLWFNTMAGFNIPIINFNSNFNDNFAKGFFKLIMRDWSGYTHNLRLLSPRILGIYSALPLHINEALVELAISIFSYSEVRCKLLKTFNKFTYLLRKLRIWRFHFILYFKHHPSGHSEIGPIILLMSSWHSRDNGRFPVERNPPGLYTASVLATITPCLYCGNWKI